MKNIFETVSFHIVKPCNMKCKFCYATFQDFKVQKQLTIDEICSILDRLHFAGVKKVTFAGGEPMLYKDLDKATQENLKATFKRQGEKAFDIGLGEIAAHASVTYRYEPHVGMSNVYIENIFDIFFLI